nr:class I SAM-dependent methyltransferase [Nocardioides daedukensis]
MNDESSTVAGRPWRATLRRSLRLVNEFRYEQPDPARFYSAIAHDSVGQLSSYTPLAGSMLLDVGGGPGYFRDAFEEAGATYFSLDADAGELAGMGGDIPERTVLGSGMELPFRDSSLDITYSSNVLEHVPEPWTMADEMVRVTKPGGLVFISYTVWYGPWGGHETSPWHYLGGARAARRYCRKHGKSPKNVFGTSMYAVTVKAGLEWAERQTAGQVLDLIPRYNPAWSHWMLKVPGVREVATWNLMIVLRKK